MTAMSAAGDAGRPGRFLVLEGIEGSGKSTQAGLLADWLAGAGVPFVLTREPGGTALGEQIRAALLHGAEMPARAELLLMLAARATLVEEVVRPALARGLVVIADRYELSTLAYQGAGRGLPQDEVRRLNTFATGGLRADFTVVLDVPLEMGEARRRAGRQGADRIEQAPRAFHERVAAAYRLLGADEDVTILDGTAPSSTVQQRLRALLVVRFPETFAVAAG